MRLLASFPSVLKKNNLVLEKRWPRNDMDVKDDPYQTLA
jgi:hypothetical protein